MIQPAIEKSRKDSLMNRTRAQELLDRLAISASALCLIHCLVTPVLLLALPIVASTMMADGEFHILMVAFVLPTSLAAFYLGVRRHRNRAIALLGAAGLLILVFAALMGHDLLGETGEKAATVAGSLLLASAHVRNYRSSRRGAV